MTLLKWVGGKTTLKDKITSLMPTDFERYHEPFCGGGAIFFHLREQGWNGHAFLSDLNTSLIITYTAVRDNAESVLTHLKVLQGQTDKDSYYTIRNEFNSDTFSLMWKMPVDEPLHAARMIYLNRACFNGLWRVNAQGGFNVSYGRYKNYHVYDPDRILRVQTALQNTTIQSIDFVQACRLIQPNDFAYFDPPYYPVGESADFTAYTHMKFTHQDQLALASEVAQLDARWVISNSFTSESEKTYGHLGCVEVVEMGRNINSKATHRQKVSEYLFWSERNESPR